IRLAGMGDGVGFGEQCAGRGERVDVRDVLAADDLRIAVIFLHHDNDVIGNGNPACGMQRTGGGSREKWPSSARQRMVRLMKFSPSQCEIRRPARNRSPATSAW